VDLLQGNRSTGVAVEADISTKFLAYCVSSGSYMVRVRHLSKAFSPLHITTSKKAILIEELIHFRLL
jgi:hypothetical protein